MIKRKILVIDKKDLGIALPGMVPQAIPYEESKEAKRLLSHPRMLKVALQACLPVVKRAPAYAQYYQSLEEEARSQEMSLKQLVAKGLHYAGYFADISDRFDRGEINGVLKDEEFPTETNMMRFKDWTDNVNDYIQSPSLE